MFLIPGHKELSVVIFQSRASSPLVIEPELGHLCDRLLSSLVNLVGKHLWLAQMWRMSRVALLHLRLGACREHLLMLRGNGVIILADQVGGRDIAPGGARDLGSLHAV